MLIPIAAAASGESIIATPSDGSSAPITRISIVESPVIFVTLIISPGRYPTVLAKSPSGNTPGSTTTALPSKDGLKDASKRHPIMINPSFDIFLKSLLSFNLFFIPAHPYAFVDFNTFEISVINLEETFFKPFVSNDLTELSNELSFIVFPVVTDATDQPIVWSEFV